MSDRTFIKLAAAITLIGLGAAAAIVFVAAHFLLKVW